MIKKTKFEWNRYTIIGLVGLLILVFYNLLGDSADCSNYTFFYKSKIRNKVLSIYKDDVGKGIDIYYYLDSKRDLFFYQNTLSFYHDFEGLQVGDSIVKEANETDFNIYKNGVFYKRAELGCI